MDVFLTISPLSRGINIPFRVLGQLIFLFSVCFLNGGLFKYRSSEEAFGLAKDNYSKPLSQN